VIFVIVAAVGVGQTHVVHDNVGVVLPALIAVSAIFAPWLWFLIRGSRVAWLLGVLVPVIVLAFHPEAAWRLAISVIQFGLLLAPASFRYVWRDRPTLPKTAAPPAS
jgi:hypothetical protein